MVRIRRIINNNNIFEPPPKSTHIFYHVPSFRVDGTMLAKQHLGAESIWIKLIEDWLSIFLDTCGEHYQFVIFAHLYNELFTVGSNLNVNCLYVAIDVDDLLYVCIPHLFEA